MSKSYKKNRDFTQFEDDFNYGKYRISRKSHLKEKRIGNALRSKNIDDLMDDEDEF